MEATATINMIEQNEKIDSAMDKEGSRLLNFIRKRIPDPEEAEDLLQDVFLEFVNQFRLPEPIEQTTAWLFAVARNKITDLFRKKKAIPFSEVSFPTEEDENLLPSLFMTDGETAEETIFRNYLLDELDAAIAELPNEQRWAFVQHEIEGLSFKEMSEITGETMNTLISRKRYAVLQLRLSLRELYNEIINND